MFTTEVIGFIAIIAIPPLGACITAAVMQWAERRDRRKRLGHIR